MGLEKQLSWIFCKACCEWICGSWAHINSRRLTSLVANEKGKTRKIKVSRVSQSVPVELVRFQIGTSATTLPLYSPEMDSARHIRIRPRLAEQYDAVHEQITSLVSVTSLSVHRAAYETTGEDEYPSRNRTKRPPVDERVDQLLRSLTVYQLSLAEQQAKVSAQFQRDILASILFNKNFDTFKNTQLSEADLLTQEDKLKDAYNELGLLDEKLIGRIHDHFEAIARSVNAIRKNRETQKPIGVNDIMPFPLLGRTQHIIELSLQAENSKRQISQPVQQFLQTLQSFLKDKTLVVSDTGELVVARDGTSIDVPHLSSGEKQLLILLTETLLQNNSPFVFLADEPELSLHIEWQGKVIDSIRSLNQHAQIIVATHSPEIAAGWNQNLLDMAEVISG